MGNKGSKKGNEEKHEALANFAETMVEGIQYNVKKWGRKLADHGQGAYFAVLWTNLDELPRGARRRCGSDGTMPRQNKTQRKSISA